MFILPAEHKINWRRPPVITLALILINVVVFFRLDADDRQLYNNAYDYYIKHQLQVVEAPEYADYLQRQVNLGLDNRFELAAEVRQAVTEDNIQDLIPLMLEDKAFVEYLALKGPEFLEPSVYQEWLPHRQHIQTQFLDELSYWQMGLIPADIQLGDLLSYQFLHGDIMHLLGNMVMLFLLGFAIEQILGKALYVLAYLFTGACGGLLFAVAEGNSFAPLVGASGAISGLMGMYVAYYRFRKIRFFYFIVFYFNYFKAPALVLFPFWLGKELYDYFYGGVSQVAYLAHAGGLISGLAFMIPWSHWYQSGFETEVSDEEQDLQFRTEVSKGLKAVSQVDFDQARSIFLKLHEHHPHDSSVLRQLFNLYKLYPDDPECNRITQLAVDDALRQNDIDEAFKFLSEYRKYASNRPLADSSCYFRLLNSCLSSNRLKEAEALLDTIAATIQDHNLLKEGFKSAIQVFKTREMPLKAKKYEKLLGELVGSEGA